MAGSGTRVTVVNQPYVFGWHDDQLYVQAFTVLEDDKRDWAKSQPKLLSKAMTPRIQSELKARNETVNWARVAQIASDPRGLALSVSKADQSIDSLLVAVPRVENRIPDGGNWDGADDPRCRRSATCRTMVTDQTQEAPRT